MGKIIIHNTSHLPDVDALTFVQAVMDKGRISNENKQYCYLTVYSVDYKNVGISTELNKNSDRFVVFDKA